MINYTRLFVSFKAVQQFLNAVPPGEFRKGACFDLFRIQTFPAFRRPAFETAVQIFIGPASANLTPFRVLAPGQFHEAVPFASFAGYILRA
jgi:hypothetical protein